MNKVTELKHSIIATLQGIQEGILEIADRINLTVQINRLRLQAYELENETKKTYAKLGKLVYQLKPSIDFKSITEHPELGAVLADCRTLESTITRIRQRHYELNEQQLDDPMLSLKQVMEQNNMQIVRLTLASNSSFKGYTLKELHLPSDTLILCVLKKNRLIIGQGDTRLDAHDRIFLLGPETEIKQITKLFFSNPQ
jgi:hypothetical protein